MDKTLKIAFALKNTYRVNSILYSLKQVPLLKKILPDTLYKESGLKVFANVLSILWEIFSAFAGKWLYFLTMVWGAGSLYPNEAAPRVFLHILLFLTLIGSFMNTHLFCPTRHQYYAVVLMGMDPQAYTLTEYAYAIVKGMIGFLPFTIWFGLGADIPLWICLLLPFSIAGCKITTAAYSLWRYERNGRIYNENHVGKGWWLCTLLGLAGAYGLPAASLLLPVSAAVMIWLAFLPAGAFGIRKIISFGCYREITWQLSNQMLHQMDIVKQTAKMASEKAISADQTITSNRKGFRYLNELFMKRHKKILWKATQKIIFVCLCLLAAALMLMVWMPEVKELLNRKILTWLPYCVFVMYAINRGTGFTQALFMNCDHSLLTYSFYKKPEFILKLFQIRLWELIKINAAPAAIIGAGLSILLYASGGTANPLHYAVLILSVVSLSVFFSVHYLTIYYLLQPYNEATEMKSATYQIVLSVTYFICFLFINLELPVLTFGVAVIAFCGVYCLMACILVYYLAPKTFKIRL